MSKFFKSCLGIAATLLIVIVGVYQCNQYNLKLDKELDNEAMEEFFKNHPNLKNHDFTILSIEDKEEFLKQIIKSDFEPFSKYGAIIEISLKQGFKQVIKFPRTLEFESLSGWGEYAGFVSNSKIEEVESGILLTSGNYRAENKLGLKVQGNYSIKYKFDGRNVEIIDIQTD
jgi:hypothetical protein